MGLLRYLPSKDLWKESKIVINKNTKLTKEKLEEIDKMKKDWWIGAKEAKSYGLITSIE
jgi:ATP-dependent protease ClpP protease subunit